MNFFIISFYLFLFDLYCVTYRYVEGVPPVSDQGVVGSIYLPGYISNMNPLTPSCSWVAMLFR